MPDAYVDEFHASNFALFLCSFETPSSALSAYHMERGEMQLDYAVGLNCEKV